MLVSIFAIRLLIMRIIFCINKSNERVFSYLQNKVTVAAWLRAVWTMTFDGINFHTRILLLWRLWDFLYAYKHIYTHTHTHARQTVFFFCLFIFWRSERKKMETQIQTMIYNKKKNIKMRYIRSEIIRIILSSGLLMISRLMYDRRASRIHDRGYRLGILQVVRSYRTDTQV